MAKMIHGKNVHVCTSGEKHINVQSVFQWITNNLKIYIVPKQWVDNIRSCLNYHVSQHHRLNIVESNELSDLNKKRNKIYLILFMNVQYEFLIIVVTILVYDWTTFFFSISHHKFCQFHQIRWRLDNHYAMNFN